MYRSNLRGIQPSTVLWCSNRMYRKTSRSATSALYKTSVRCSSNPSSIKVPERSSSVARSMCSTSDAGKTERSSAAAVSGLVNASRNSASWGDRLTPSPWHDGGLGATFDLERIESAKRTCDGGPKFLSWAAFLGAPPRTHSPLDSCQRAYSFGARQRKNLPSIEILLLGIFGAVSCPSKCPETGSCSSPKSEMVKLIEEPSLK